MTELNCPECSQPKPKPVNKFCSQSCANRWSGRMFPRRTKKVRTCASCGSTEVKRQRKYCPTCIEKNVYSTAATDVESVKQDRTRRAVLIRERGHSCAVCKLGEWVGQPIPLELDHIDGNPDNNSEGNLRLICPNCHALTPTYKGRNRGNSTRQAIRRERYADGKTY